MQRDATGWRLIVLVVRHVTGCNWGEGVTGCNGMQRDGASSSWSSVMCPAGAAGSHGAVGHSCSRKARADGRGRAVTTAPPVPSRSVPFHPVSITGAGGP